MHSVGGGGEREVGSQSFENGNNNEPTEQQVHTISVRVNTAVSSSEHMNSPNQGQGELTTTLSQIIGVRFIKR